MIYLDIKCPSCGEVYKYKIHTLGRDIFCLGDFIDSSNKSYFKNHIKQCFNCNKAFSIYEIIKDGRLVNFFINPSRKELGDIENFIFNTLNNYPTYYKTSFIKDVLYGQNTQIIPSQFSTSLLLKNKEEIYFFGIFWRVDSAYKVVNKRGDLVSKIYKIISKNADERLLVLRDNYLPELKEVDWKVNSCADKLEALKKYIIPKNCELVFLP